VSISFDFPFLSIGGVSGVGEVVEGPDILLLIG
jgi:hypothetical protein